MMAGCVCKGLRKDTDPIYDGEEYRIGVSPKSKAQEPLVIWVDFDRRPAVLIDGEAWMLRKKGAPWERVNSAEVNNSGTLMNEEDCRYAFKSRFGSFPPLPR